MDWTYLIGVFRDFVKARKNEFPRNEMWGCGLTLRHTRYTAVQYSSMRGPFSFIYSFVVLDQLRYCQLLNKGPFRLFSDSEDWV